MPSKDTTPAPSLVPDNASTPTTANVAGSGHTMAPNPVTGAIEYFDAAGTPIARADAK